MPDCMKGNNRYVSHAENSRVTAPSKIKKMEIKIMLSIIFPFKEKIKNSPAQAQLYDKKSAQIFEIELDRAYRTFSLNKIISKKPASIKDNRELK